MSQNSRVQSARERVAAFRARRREAGMVEVKLFVPGELVEAVDRLKNERSVQSREPLFEEALRLLIEKETRAK